jgi:hypothetical protein
MRDTARDPATLELLRVQRDRLADRMRPPWWYLTGSAIAWALLFVGPFILHYLLHGVPTWPSLIGTAAVLCLLRLPPWGLARATGIAVRLRNLRYRPGLPALIAMIVVWFAASKTETFLIAHGVLAAAIAVAALAVAAQVTLLQARLRGIRQGGCETAEGRRDRQAGPVHSPDHPVVDLRAAGRWRGLGRVRRAA